ncbi:helix-turn-helix domain-containing protein [Pseudomonas oryzihabitans]|uniref:AraC family transcriptional regulator n=1 Tax=Pseudomonas oryzihabitans TaxID=47885 RepID=UPI002895B043|nr:helix-turn-helix domain-containing protein [Pseudomonas oryzihabitans]MDT3720794.1 helix-turn-helix domain-containing protein [Pseudomonas oryzihabitans]
MQQANFEVQTRSGQVNEACRWMSAVCGPHRLEARSGAELSFHHQGVRLPGRSTVVGRIGYGAAVQIGIEALDAYSLSLPLQGRQSLASRGARVRSDSHCGVVVSPHEWQRLDMAADCFKLQVVIRREALQEVAQTLLGRPLDEPLSFCSEMELARPSVAAWWQGVRQLLEGWSGVQALYGQPALANDLEVMLLKGLLLAQPHNYSASLAEGADSGYPEFLLRARRYLESHARENPSLECLEQVAGVSRAKLYASFRRYHGQPPMAYLKRLRLEGVRRLLLARREGANVSRIALDWGFEHLGRFASDYRQTFGETPSQTLAGRRFN